MHPFFLIRSSDIKALNDAQARELVARLCKAELQTKGAGTEAVTWGGDQRAKDGGVDVRVEIAPGISISGYIPTDATVFQVKAEPFGKSKIPGEMAPKGILRQAISDLVVKSGAYIIVSTRDDLSDSSLSDRQDAMAGCLEEHGLKGKVHLDFYDSRKIADWVEKFPSIATWVRSVLGKPVEGWQTYGPWAYHETSIEDEYLLDDKVKVFLPDSEEGITVTLAINRLRGELGTNGISARIVGLSGVGKTRFAQALFDHRIVTSNAAPDKDNILYTDLSDNPNPQPSAMLEALVLEGSDSVVIVDNCGQDVHQKLTEIVKRTSSKLRLLTIEYDIRDDLPEGTTCYRLEGASNEVIAKLLKRNYKAISDLDIDKIVEFSDGNARVAFALASTSETKGELAQLRDAELFQRLFVQKHTESDELQKCAEAASLLYSFDVEDLSETSELAILASVGEVTVNSFLRNVVELQRRGLIQERGKWRAVLPHAISNRLALKAIEAYPQQLLVQKLVTDATERVARSFTRRLGYLHESKHARSVIDEWLKPGGLLGDVAQLNELKRQMLENVAPVSQRAALNALLRAVENKDFISISNPSRSQFARLLRSLAYEKDQFEDAATALLKFALEEPDDYKSDSIRDILQSLFYLHLSGTQALPGQRAAFLETLVVSGDMEKQKLALILLHAGLESQHFTSHHTFDFGALKRSYGWWPTTLKEIREWYGLFIQIAVELGKATAPIGTDARSLLGRAFRGLWVDARMGEALTDAARELVAVDGWPDGWIGLRNTLHWDKARLDGASLETLRALEKELSPKNLLTKIQAKVLSHGRFGVELDDESELESELATGSASALYEKAQKEAEELGKEAALDVEALADLTPYVCVSSTDKLWPFGYGVGLISRSVQEIMDRIKPIFEKPNRNTLTTLFIRGLVAGWSKSKPDEASLFLENALSDNTWGAMFPELQIAVGLDDIAHARLMKSLELGKAPSWQFQYLGYGRATDSLSVEQIVSLIGRLATKLDNGLGSAIDVLYMVIHCLDNKNAEYRTELQAYCTDFVADLDWVSIDFLNENSMAHLEEIIEFGLSGNEVHEAASKALNRLFQQTQSNKHILPRWLGKVLLPFSKAFSSVFQREKSTKQIFPRRLGNILLPFFKICPIETLNAVYSQKGNSQLMRMLVIRLDRHGDTAIGAAPEAALIDWCKISPEDRCTFAAQGCKLFERPTPHGPDDEEAIGITSTARSVLAVATDKKKILEILVSRFSPNSWSGSRAAIMRQRFQLLEQLNPTDDMELRVLIEDIKIRLSEAILREEHWEQERERSETGSFE